MVEAETDGLARGLSLCQEAQRIESVSGLVQGHIHSRMGLLAMRSGDLVRAMDEFVVAEPFLKDDPSALTGLLMNRGNISMQRESLASAAQDFLAVLDIADSDRDRAMAKHNLGYVEYLRGNFLHALSLMQEASPILDPVSPIWRAINESDRAEVLFACGMPDQAASALESAANAFSVRRLRQSQGEAELARARILLERDPDSSYVLGASRCSTTTHSGK